MKIRNFFVIMIILSILISSCDEINKLVNPSGEYLIDKAISSSSAEQVVESGTEFKMIFPANSLNGDITLKIKKEGSYPTFSIPNAKLGSNTYRIKFSGNTAFASPVKIIINYDKSQIPDGKAASEIIQAYIYSGGNWKIPSYELDEPNSNIIISISNLGSPKVDKDKPELQGDGDLIISNGNISINDTGNNDDTLSRYNFVSFTLHMGCDRFQWDFKDISKYKSTIMEWYFDEFVLEYKKNGRYDIQYDTTWQWSHHGDKDVTANKVANGYIQLSADLKYITEFKLKIEKKSTYLDGSWYNNVDNIILQNLPEKHDFMDDRNLFSFGYVPSGMFDIYYPCNKNFVSIFDIYNETSWASNDGEIGYDQSIFNCTVCETATEKAKKGYDEQMCSIEINLKKKN